MAKVILSNQKLETVDTFYMSFTHHVQVLNQEEVGLYLDFVAKEEGYSSVELYLKSNPVWVYPVPETLQLEELFQR